MLLPCDGLPIDLDETMNNKRKVIWIAVEAILAMLGVTCFLYGSYWAEFIGWFWLIGLLGFPLIIADRKEKDG